MNDGKAKARERGVPRDGSILFVDEVDYYPLEKCQRKKWMDCSM